MINDFLRSGNSLTLKRPVKRRWALLASNPSRNSRTKLIADDGQGMFFPACPIPRHRPGRKAGTGSSALLVERFKRRLMGSFVPDSVLLRLGFEAEEGWHDHTFAASAS